MTEFTFDLQRFDLLETQDTSKHVFSVTTSSGTKYGEASDFTTTNLNGATSIQLLSDFTIANGVEISSTCTLDTNNKTLTYSGTDSAIKVLSNGSLTKSTAGKILASNSSGTAVEVANGGSYFHQNGYLQSSVLTNATGASLKVADKGANVTISGGGIGNGSSKTALSIISSDTATETTASTVKITGGTVSTKSGLSGAITISNSSNVVVEVTGGTIKQGEINGSLKVSGGEVIATGGNISVSSENFTGGTIQAPTTLTALSSLSNYKLNVNADTIYYSSQDTQTTAKTSYESKAFATSGDESNKVYYTNAAGINTAVDAGTSITLTDKGKNNLIALVSNSKEKYYVTLSNAYNAATNGDTIKLLGNVTLSGMFSRLDDMTKQVTLDLNGTTTTLSNAYIYIRQERRQTHNYRFFHNKRHIDFHRKR